MKSGLLNNENNDKRLSCRAYYNYVRPHQGLNGGTPAQAAGIELELGQNRWMELLRKSLQHHNDNKDNAKSTEAGQQN
jgi:hypothetical protein